MPGKTVNYCFRSGRKPATRRALIWGFGWALGAALVPQVGIADDGPLGPLQLRLSRNVSWDSNVQRLPDSAPDPQGRSDRISTTTIGAAFDQSYSLQRLVAHVSQTAVRYNKFNNLDRDSTGYGVE